jgi:MYXO-CTERM domain-containing protein
MPATGGIAAALVVAGLAMRRRRRS